MSSRRTLIAFAYVADQFEKTNDIAQGLIPLFAPLISERAGTPFDPVEFAEDIKNTYDIDMHPFVAEEFGALLAAHGHLDVHREMEVVHYTNLKCDLPDPPIQENQLHALVDEFRSFSTPLLTQAGSAIPADRLESAFFDRLVQPDFLGLLLRPDRPPSEPRTLSLRQNDSADTNETVHVDQQLDYLVASFILRVHKNNPHLFDIVVAAATGALVSEVILSLQRPSGDPQPMSGIKVALDSPLILDALELGHEGATPYAKKLIEQIQEAGAEAVVFEDTIEELRGALTAPLRNYEQRQETYGPLGRRLRRVSTVAPYVRLILPRIREELHRLGIGVLEMTTVERAKRWRVFTEDNENRLGDALGTYERDNARRHDARVISDVLRLRGRDHFTSITHAKLVFASRNVRLVSRARQFLTQQPMFASDYFPPCISDRHLAGLLWISMGGGGETLSRLRLIANCSAAVVPRRDLVSRLHKFITELNPAMIVRFNALMTNERTEYFLMDRTLSDAAVITQENFEEIYTYIEEAAAERVTERMNIEIDSLKTDHQEEIATFRARLAELDEVVRSTQDGTRQLTEERGELRDELARIEQTWANACLQRGRRVTFFLKGVVTSIIAVVATVAAVLEDDNPGFLLLIATLTFISSFAAGFLGNRFWPTNPLERWIARQRDTAVSKFAQRHNVEHVLAKYEFDWKKYSANIKE